MVIAKSGFTLDDFLRLPEEEPPPEYEDGRVTRKVSPPAQHSELQAFLAEVLPGLELTVDPVFAVLKAD